MGLFVKDYESAGSGISKNAPKKTGAKLFFDLVFRKFGAITELNLLYMLFWLPLVLALASLTYIKNNVLSLSLSIVMALLFLVLIGPATAGMTKVTRNFVLDRHTFIIRDFFSGFRVNFKKACIIGFADSLVVLSSFASYQVYPVLAQQYSKVLYVPMVITFSLALIVAMMNYYIYLMLIATNLSLKNLFKNSFALAFVSLKTNFLTFLISLVALIPVALVFRYFHYLFLFVILFFPVAFLRFISSFNSYPVIQKYVINPYYASIGEVNPELAEESSEDAIFEDMGGKEKPIEKRKKGKGRHIS